MLTEGAKGDQGGMPHKYSTIGQGKWKVHKFRGAATADAIKKASIRGPSSKGEIQHGLIKSNMMSFLYRLCRPERIFRMVLSKLRKRPANYQELIEPPGCWTRGEDKKSTPKDAK